MARELELEIKPVGSPGTRVDAFIYTVEQESPPTMGDDVRLCISTSPFEVRLCLDPHEAYRLGMHLIKLAHRATHKRDERRYAEVAMVQPS
jgi:hypothetical protein